MVNSLLFGEKTGSFSQFRGGVGVFAYDNVVNPSLSNGNSGHAASLTAGLPANQSAVVGIASNASAGSDWRCKVPFLGLVVV